MSFATSKYTIEDYAQGTQELLSSRIVTKSDQKHLSLRIMTRLDSDQPVRLILVICKSAIQDDDQVRLEKLSSWIVTKSDSKLCFSGL